MSPEAPKANEKPKEAVKIPAFLNCSLTAKANTVLYDNLILKEVSGKLSIKDQKVSLENVKSSVLAGKSQLVGMFLQKKKYQHLL